MGRYLVSLYIFFVPFLLSNLFLCKITALGNKRLEDDLRVKLRNDGDNPLLEKFDTAVEEGDGYKRE